MGNIDAGLSGWKMTSNHNRMMELQRTSMKGGAGSVKIDYFGSSAFKITSPSGVTLMIDPWRNHPSRKWDWYFDDFPLTEVDIGISSHAHFDHDALHLLDAHVLLDRLIGTYTFGDIKITGIADKHATDSSAAVYDFKRIIKEFDNIDITPPNNPRSWDHCLLLIETGGLKILAWGDNRHNPPEEVWGAVNNVDIVLLPIDDSQHVISFPHAEEIIQRLSPSVIIPHHYYIFDVTVRQSTLQPAEKWLETQKNIVRLMAESTTYHPKDLIDVKNRIDFFGDHVAFDKKKWLNESN
ncbi:MBL fold metallo-hydrolase [Alphaproteobacteria bacterium]|jgi:L-ascorbate metabolism protein UlaG (beta-lactamase superfamily)|nr:MBL fold metallo-hydrolase [Alphaproteobacteria bacterium]|tara:strand:- start:122 stop:1006 length:885 start_codon:yes stop_codon:yes gene_type:complete